MKASASKRAVLAVMAMLTLVVFAAVPAMAEQVTVKGTVTDDFQIVDNSGESYEVVETSLGDELVTSAAGKMVEVKGTVQEEDGVKTITVSSYKVLSE